MTHRSFMAPPSDLVLRNGTYRKRLGHCCDTASPRRTSLCHRNSDPPFEVDLRMVGYDGMGRIGMNC
jgi:hypothetical protein